MCMCVSMYVGDKNMENGLNRFFFENTICLPFSLVRLGRVSVHSDPDSCTFAPYSLYIPVRFLYSWPPFLYSWFFCTVGYFICTVGPIFRTLGVCLLYSCLLFFVQLVVIR